MNLDKYDDFDYEEIERDISRKFGLVAVAAFIFGLVIGVFIMGLGRAADISYYEQANASLEQANDYLQEQLGYK